MLAGLPPREAKRLRITCARGQRKKLKAELPSAIGRRIRLSQFDGQFGRQLDTHLEMPTSCDGRYPKYMLGALGGLSRKASAR